MSISDTVLKQYQSKVDREISRLSKVKYPPEGWVRTVRKALRLSMPQLAKRLGTTRADIFRKEKSELNGSITIKSMQQLAQAMECTFVFAIIPNGKDVQNIIQDRALLKAKKLVMETNQQMALEKQAIDQKTLENEIKRVADELVKTMPSNLWVD